MTFHEALTRAQALGFGLAYKQGDDAWHVLRGRDVVHVATDPQSAIEFCEAWNHYVRG